jgi:hypothetical protein
MATIRKVLADTAVIIFVYFGSGIMVTVAVFLHGRSENYFCQLAEVFWKHEKLEVIP